MSLMQHHKSSMIVPFGSVSSNILSCPHLPGSQGPGCHGGYGRALLWGLELLLHLPPPPLPILYRFYHEDINLGSSSAPSGEGASFNLSLTAGHSGSYSCEADNGLGAQFSELVPLSISGGLMVPGYRSSIIVNGFILVPYLGFRK